ncbi:hypothetical protein ABK040_008304 [Willaertia magna]
MLKSHIALFLLLTIFIICLTSAVTSKWKVHNKGNNNRIINKFKSSKRNNNKWNEIIEVESDTNAYLGQGSTLQVTEALKVRDGPCTDRRIITVLSVGTKVTFTGESSNSCGYVWHKISGSFGTGFAASNWLKEISNAGDKGIITTLPTGTRVTLTGESHNSCGYQWLGISGNFGRGFAAANWLRPEGGGNPGQQCNPRRYPLFKQCDNAWSGNRMGRSNIILCREGCVVSSISMALAGTGKFINGQSANPARLNAWLTNNGGYVYPNHFIWSSVDRLGLIHERSTSNRADIRASICAGKVVILTVKNGGHYVLATGVGNGVFFVNDAGYNINSYPEGQVILAHIYRA